MGSLWRQVGTPTCRLGILFIQMIDYHRAAAALNSIHRPHPEHLEAT
jgi:hypothetical protein